MRILSCYIENFGALHQYTLDFSENITTVVQHNGWGKTTLAAFVRAMFYGLEYKPRAKVADSDRKKFKPWQGGMFGGNLIFYANGKTYRVERSFGTKGSEDTFVLYDHVTGLVSEDFSENLGEELFQVDRESYGYTTFFGQNGLTMSGTDMIYAGLSEGGTADEKDMDNYSRAMRQLEEAAKEYKKTGGRGSLDIKSNQIAKLMEESKVAQANADAYAIWNDKRAHIHEEIRKTRQESEKLEQQVKSASLAESSRTKLLQLEGLKKRKEELSNELIEGERYFHTTDRMKLISIRQQLIKAIDSAKDFANKMQELTRDENKLDALEMLHETRYEQKEDKIPDDKQPVIGYVLWMILTVIAALAGVIFLKQPELIAGLCALPIVSLAVVIMRLKRAANQKQQMQRAYEDRQRANQEQRQQLEERHKKVQMAQADLQEHKQRLIQELSVYQMTTEQDFVTAFSLLLERLHTYEKLCEDLEHTQVQLAQFLEQNDEEQLCKEAKEPEELASVMRLRQDTERKLYEQMEEEKRYLLQLQQLEGEEEKAGELLAEAERLTEQLKQETQDYENLILTMELLKQAKDHFSSRYMDNVRKAFKEYCDRLGLTGQVQPMLDTNLNLSVQAKGQQREIAYFSAGEKAGLWICARMALIRALYKEEHPCLILDDPFTELDEMHLDAAKDMLQEFCKEYQILYLTCQKQRGIV